MSRGHGRVQRAITEAVLRPPHEEERFQAVRAIAGKYALDQEIPYTTALTASFRRAARQLVEQGVIDAHDVLLYTLIDEAGRPRQPRYVVAVGPPGEPLDEQAAQSIGLGYALYNDYEEDR